jgi:hypothetical protein
LPIFPVLRSESVRINKIITQKLIQAPVKLKIQLANTLSFRMKDLDDHFLMENLPMLMVVIFKIKEAALAALGNKNKSPQHCPSTHAEDAITKNLADISPKWNGCCMINPS